VTEPVRLSLTCWPRLLSLKLAGLYCSVSSRTVEEWIHDGIITPVGMPGISLRDRSGNIIAHAKARKIAKTLLDINDLNALVEMRKAMQ